MHGLLKHIHGGDNHSHAEPAPQTTGRLIRWAKYYDLVTQIMALGQAGRLRRKTIEVAQLVPGERVLDVGCGTGDLTLLAKKSTGPTGQVVGLDPAPEMIDVARSKAKRQQTDVEFRTGVIERLPFPDDSFDVVLSSLMMHHLPDDLKPKALAEIRRVIKPGGRLVIVDFKGLLDQQVVVALVNAAKFTQIGTLGLWFNVLGFVLARKA